MGVLLEVTLIQRMYDRPLDTLLVTSVSDWFSSR